MKWIRTCQECGNKQEMPSPTTYRDDSWRSLLCRECKSEALDYGQQTRYAQEVTQ